MKKVYQSSKTTNAPLSGAWEVDDLVFVSGQIHLDDAGQLVGETIEEQYEVVIGNVKRLLAEAGLTLKDVVRVHLYLTNIQELPALNAVYGNYFDHPYPARTAIGVAALPLGANLEMDVIAHKS